MAWSLQFLGYLRTFSLKFQKATSKIEVVLALPCWLSQFWSFKLKVLKYSWNCSLHNTLIPNLVKPLIRIYWLGYDTLICTLFSMTSVVEYQCWVYKMWTDWKETLMLFEVEACQADKKLGPFLQNKGVQKLKLSKNVLLFNPIFFQKNHFWKNQFLTH